MAEAFAQGVMRFRSKYPFLTPSHLSFIGTDPSWPNTTTWPANSRFWEYKFDYAGKLRQAILLRQVQASMLPLGMTKPPKSGFRRSMHSHPAKVTTSASMLSPNLSPQIRQVKPTPSAHWSKSTIRCMLAMGPPSPLSQMSPLIPTTRSPHGNQQSEQSTSINLTY